MAELSDFRSGYRLSTCGQGSGRDQAAPEGVNPRPTIKVLPHLLNGPLPRAGPVKTHPLNKQPGDIESSLCSLLQMRHHDSGVLLTVPTKTVP